MMGNELVTTSVQMMKWKLMTWHDQHIAGDLALDLFDRPQIEPKRVAVRINRPYAHVRRDPCQHFVSRKEQLVGRAVQHYLLGCVTLAGKNQEASIPYLQNVAVDDT